MKNKPTFDEEIKKTYFKNLRKSKEKRKNKIKIYFEYLRLYKMLTNLKGKENPF